MLTKLTPALSKYINTMRTSEENAIFVKLFSEDEKHTSFQKWMLKRVQLFPLFHLPSLKSLFMPDT